MPHEHREDGSGKQHDCKPLQRRIERRIGLLNRQLNEHGPAERRDRSGCRQNLLTLDIGRLLQGVRHGATSQRGTHLREAGHVGIAQDQADVGMRDQPPLRTDHVSVSVLPDLDLGHDVPDQLEIDLRDADTGILARA